MVSISTEQREIETTRSTLQKIALIGLNQYPDPWQPLLASLPQGEQLLACLQRSTGNPAQRFLQGLSLMHASCDYSRLPMPEQADELPRCPAELLPPLSTQQQASLHNFLRCEAETSFWLLAQLLFQQQRHLPQEIWLQLLDASPKNRGLRLLLAQLMSERLKWLARLAPDLLDGESITAPEQLPIPEHFVAWLAQADDGQWQLLDALWPNLPPQWQGRYLRELHQAPDALLLRVVPQLWQVSPASGRERLIPLVAQLCCSDDAALSLELWQWLQPLRKDRSSTIQELITPLFWLQAQRLPAALRDDAWQATEQALAHQLARYFPPPGKGKIDPLAPEQLTDELAALGLRRIKDAPLAISLLQQLLAIAGAQRLAASWQLSVDEAIKQIAKCHFSDELKYPLLNSLLIGRDHAGLASWCRHYRKDKEPAGARLSHSLTHYSARDAEALLTLLADSSQHELITQDASLGRHLAEAAIQLSPALSERLLERLLKASGIPDTQFLHWAAVLQIAPARLAQIPGWSKKIDPKGHSADALQTLAQAMAFKAASNEF